jgi:hypothetical protein
MSVCLSVYGYAALVDLGRFFSSLIHAQSVGFLGRGISPSQGRYLHTGQHKHRINVHRHPYLDGNSNPRSQCSSRRRQLMPYTARPLWWASKLSLNLGKCPIHNKTLAVIQESEEYITLSLLEIFVRIAGTFFLRPWNKKRIITSVKYVTNTSLGCNFHAARNIKKNSQGKFLGQKKVCIHKKTA